MCLYEAGKRENVRRDDTQNKTQLKDDGRTVGTVLARVCERVCVRARACLSGSFAPRSSGWKLIRPVLWGNVLIWQIYILKRVISNCVVRPHNINQLVRRVARTRRPDGQLCDGEAPPGVSRVHQRRSRRVCRGKERQNNSSHSPTHNSSWTVKVV